MFFAVAGIVILGTLYQLQAQIQLQLRFSDFVSGSVKCIKYFVSVLRLKCVSISSKTWFISVCISCNQFVNLLNKLYQYVSVSCELSVCFANVSIFSMCYLVN